MTGDGADNDSATRRSFADVVGTTRRWTLLTLLVSVPLLVTPSFTLDPYNLPKLALLMVGVSIAGGLRLVEAALGRRSSIAPGMWLPAAAATAPLFISWSFSPHRSWALWGEFTRLQGLIPYVVVVVFGVLLLDAFHRRPEYLAWAITISGAGAGLVATYQMVFTGDQIAGVSTSGYVTATLGHSNFAGGFLAIALPLGVILWLQGGRGRWVAIVCTALIADGLAFTFSQGAWAAAAAGVLVAIGVHLSPTRRRVLPVALTLSGGIAALTFGSVLLGSASNDVVDRFPSLATGRSRGFLWRQAAELFSERPLVGWGPNAYALEAPSRRIQEEAIAGGMFFGDDPHSVPLAMAANNGLLGIVGFLLVLLWPVILWRRADRSVDPAAVRLSAAFAGGLAAYATQALVSLDEIALRVELWACLAGFIALLAPAQGVSNKRGENRFFLRAGVALGLCICVLIVTLGVATLWADHLALKGVKAVGDHQVARGSELIRRAIDLRDAFEYRRTYAAALGETAVEQESAGRPLVEEMVEQFEILDARGDPHADRNQARFLFAWSLFDRDVLWRALDLYREALRDDPWNPILAVNTSDVLFSLGRFDQALELLRRFDDLLSQTYPRYRVAGANQEFWGALAVAEAEAGSPDAARRAIEVSESAGGDECRTWIARELLEPPERHGRPAGIGFLCPEVLLRLLPENGV